MGCYFFLSWLFEPVCLFKAHVYVVGLVTHYSCRLGLMVFFNYSHSQFLAALIIGLFFPLGFPQMALNTAMAEKVPVPDLVFTLETLVARRAVLFVQELGLRNVIFEGD